VIIADNLVFPSDAEAAHLGNKRIQRWHFIQGFPICIM
jgi:hypothetical protein